MGWGVITSAEDYESIESGEVEETKMAYEFKKSDNGKLGLLTIDEVTFSDDLNGIAQYLNDWTIVEAVVNGSDEIEILMLKKKARDNSSSLLASKLKGLVTLNDLDGSDEALKEETTNYEDFSDWEQS